MKQTLVEFHDTQVRTLKHSKLTWAGNLKTSGYELSPACSFLLHSWKFCFEDPCYWGRFQKLGGWGGLLGFPALKHWPAGAATNLGTHCCAQQERYVHWAGTEGISYFERDFFFFIFVKYFHNASHSQEFKNKQTMLLKSTLEAEILSKHFWQIGNPACQRLQG